MACFSSSLSLSSLSSFPETPSLQDICIPRTYKVLKVMGAGSFGTVVKCRKRSTREIFAVKIPRNFHNLQREASMLKVLMKNNLDKFNIVKYHGGLISRGQMSLVFENLDTSLYAYLTDLDSLLRLKHTRTIIQQLAIAFVALKRIGIIHTDVKLDNIMLVDRVRQPFRVKLIDFGLATFRSGVKQGCPLQTPYYRAPEIMLGLPFSEAIDIWSLGCVMATMVFGCMLFPATLNYKALRLMTDLLGPPPQHLIKAGWYSKLFFRETDSNQWILKTPEEYWGRDNVPTDNRFYTFRSLDETKTTRLEMDNNREPDERRECIELLKAMLHWDGEERITPAGILNHPFITRSYLSSSSHLSSCNEPGPSSSSWTKKMARVDDSTSKTLPSRVTLVRQAPRMNRIHLEETSEEDSEMSPHSASPASSLDTTRVHPDEGFSDDKDQTKKDRKKDDQTTRGRKKVGKKEKDHKKDDQNEKDCKKEDQKRKNCFRRFCSWMKRTFSFR